MAAQMALVSLIAMAVTVCTASASAGGDTHPKRYLCAYSAAEPVIDGKLSDAVWRRAPWTDDFVDIEGDLRPRPTYRTRVKMLWNEQWLFIGAELEEPHVWATLRQRDTVIFQDNDFELFIDPDGDNHEYAEFEINALNTGWDLFLNKPYRDGGLADNSWNIQGLKTAVHVEGTLNEPGDVDRGWSVEIAIPWAALKELAHRPASPAEGDQWRANFSRVEWDHELIQGAYRKIKGRPEHNWVWSPQGVIDMHRPEKWGYVQFTRGSARGKEPSRDPSHPARECLMGIYYAEQRYHKEHQRWTSSLHDLGIPDTAEFSPTIEATPTGYRATVIQKPASGLPQVWRVREDSKIWMEDHR